MTLAAIEGSTGIYQATLLDENDAPILLAQIGRLVGTLTFSNGEIVNGHDETLLIDAGVPQAGVSYDETTGRLSWELGQNDFVLRVPTRRSETLELTLEMQYGPSGAKRFNHCTRIVVRNLAQV